MTERKPFLQIRNIIKDFGSFRALSDISLDIYESEFVCFLGPSGCGKTTLLRVVAGLEPQTTGTIIQDDKDISALPPSLRDFGIVFQSYALFPNLTVDKNVAYGLKNEGKSRDEIKSRVTELLALVSLPDQGSKYPAQLSGGQQQRVALARALATSPGLLLLDEPLSALDAKVRGYLRHEIKDLQRNLGVTTIMVTHDQEEALTMADRIVVMDHGTIEQVGSPTEIYRQPASLFVADFIGAMNKIQAEASGKNEVKIGGLTLGCQDHDLKAGSAGVLTIRPEDVVPHAPDDDRSRNSLSATIKDQEFLGSFWRATLTGGDLGKTSIIADFSINAVRRLKLETGATITVELPEERLKLFPAEKGA